MSKFAPTKCQLLSNGCCSRRLHISRLTITITHAYQLNNWIGRRVIGLHFWFFISLLTATKDRRWRAFMISKWIDRARIWNRFFITTHTHFVYAYNNLLYTIVLLCFAFISIHFNSCPIEMCTLAVVDFVPSYQPASYSHNLFHIEWSISEGKSNANRKISNKTFNQQQYVHTLRYLLKRWMTLQLIFYFFVRSKSFQFEFIADDQSPTDFPMVWRNKIYRPRCLIFVWSSEIYSDNIFCNEIMRILPDAIFVSIIQRPLNLIIHVKLIFFSVQLQHIQFVFLKLQFNDADLKKSTLFKYKYVGSSKLCRSYRSKWRFCLMNFCIDLIIYCTMSKAIENSAIKQTKNMPIFLCLCGKWCAMLF